MAKFKDNDGREWDVRITVADIRPLREIGIRPRELLKDDLKGLGELAEDDERFVAGLYALCERQADKVGVSPEEFGRALWGDPLADAWDAFCYALSDFFPSQRRLVLRALVGKTKDITVQLTTDALKSLNEIDTEKAAAAIQAEYLRRTRSNASVGNSPGSSESIPAG